MAAENISQISECVKIEGTLNFPCSVKIDGEVSGDIKVGGCLTIGKNAKVEANIQTKDVIIPGYFKGEMHVSGQIEITSTGKFIGDLIQDNELLIIEKGGLFKGKSIMMSDSIKKIVLITWKRKMIKVNIFNRIITVILMLCLIVFSIVAIVNVFVGLFEWSAIVDSITNYITNLNPYILAAILFLILVIALIILIFEFYRRKIKIANITSNQSGKDYGFFKNCIKSDKRKTYKDRRCIRSKRKNNTNA